MDKLLNFLLFSFVHTYFLRYVKPVVHYVCPFVNKYLSQKLYALHSVELPSRRCPREEALLQWALEQIEDDMSAIFTFKCTPYCQMWHTKGLAYTSCSWTTDLSAYPEWPISQLTGHLVPCISGVVQPKSHKSSLSHSAEKYKIALKLFNCFLNTRTMQWWQPWCS